MLEAAPARSRPLVLNMDETAIGKCFPGLRGTIAKTARGSGSPCAHATLSDQRSGVSYLACVADDPTVQAQLPQVILGNKHQFTLDLLRSIAGALPPNVVLWRQASSWNCHATMRKWLSLLAKALGTLLAERYVVLLLDVHPSHIHNSIFLHARRCGVRIVYIPAKMTRFFVLSSLSGEHLILKLAFMCTFVHVQKTFLSRMSHVSTFCMFDFGMLEILWTAVCAAASLERVRTKFHRAR